MPTLDDVLYKWISRANTKLDDFDLPVGLVEDSVALLKRVLGTEYLQHLLIEDSEPVHFLDDEANPIRKWLLSARVAQHIIQVMELAAYFRAFQDDAALPDKVTKLKKDSFWPMLFELAMATRMRRSCQPPQELCLNPETANSIGDFTITIPGWRIPCECSRLGRSSQITDGHALTESLSNRISSGTRRIGIPLCLKIRSTQALTGATYNGVLQLLRKGLADARGLKLPTEHGDGSTTVFIERLTASSEQIPFRSVDGEILDIVGTDWDSATRLNYVPAKNPEEISERYDRGEKFHQYEAVRVFTKFGETADDTDVYARITSKLKKKLKQTKTSTEHFGKIVLIEVPFDLRLVNENKLADAVREAAIHSRTALAIVLAHREAGAQIRHCYSQFGKCNETAVGIRPEVLDPLNRMSVGELTIDPILGLPYRRTWDEAQRRTRDLFKFGSE
jgi:hypothetical protein